MEGSCKEKKGMLTQNWIEYLFSDFQKMDIRIGQIISAEKIKESKKLLILKVDIGNDKIQIVAGLAKYAEPQQLINKKIAVLTNLEKKRLMGIESQGMLLAADNNGIPILLTIDNDAPVGSKMT